MPHSLTITNAINEALINHEAGEKTLSLTIKGAKYIITLNDNGNIESAQRGDAGHENKSRLRTWFSEKTGNTTRNEIKRQFDFLMAAKKSKDVFKCNNTHVMPDEVKSQPNHVIQFLCHGSNDTKDNFTTVDNDVIQTPMSNFIDKAAKYNKFETYQYSGVGEDHESSLGKFRGYIFGHGADRQSNDIKDKVISKLTSIGKGETLEINLYGLSRGGVVELLALKKIDTALSLHPDGSQLRARLKANVSLCDPVPGNWHSTKKIDFINYSLVNRTIDLSSCDFVREAKVFISAAGNSIEGPSNAHTPLIPKFSKETNASVFLVDGMHSGSERVYGYTYNEKIKYYLTDSAEKIFDETKKTFQFSTREGIDYKNVSESDCFSVLNELGRDKLNSESQRYRTVFTVNGTVDLVPSENEEHHKNGIYNQFSIRNANLKDSYLFDYRINNSPTSKENVIQKNIMSIINSRGDDTKRIKVLLRDSINNGLALGHTIEQEDFKKIVRILCESTGRYSGSKTAATLASGLNNHPKASELKKYLGLPNHPTINQRNLRASFADDASN